MNKRRGILGAGNWMVDYNKKIDGYPEQDTLATIKSVSKSTGGAAYNILIDLAKLGAGFPLTGIGLIGKDTDGKKILDDCRNFNIDHKLLKEIDEAGTSYTDVMLVEATGRRTFFTYRGANAFLDIKHFPFEKTNAKIMHMGYPLLLDKLDEFYDSNLTRGAYVLKNAKENGIITSLDLVSENSDRFKQIISPYLSYVDILFLNEFEASNLTGINLIGNLGDSSLLKEAISLIFQSGVNDWIILHFPDGAIAGNKKGEFIFQGSVKIPQKMIQGTPGAGDAFASGVLLGIHDNKAMTDCLKTGACVAGASILAPGCSDGILKLEECLKIGNDFGFRD